MIRYIAIGGVVGFVLAVLLLSRSEAPPIAAAPLPAPAPTQVFLAPEGIRRKAELRVEDVKLGRAPSLLQHLEAPALDAGG